MPITRAVIHVDSIKPALKPGRFGYVRITTFNEQTTEGLRKQIEDQRKANAGKADVLASLDALDHKMLDVELRLVSHSDLNSDDKYYVERYRVYMNLIWLSGEVGSGAGDVAGGADQRPTDASMATLGEIERELGAAKAAYERLLRDDVPAFNKMNAGKIANIAVR